MINQIINEAKLRMEKSIEMMKTEFAKLRTGRAHSSLLDHVMVPYYGTDTPLSQVANVVASDARTLTITPWERPLIPAIEKAILTAGLGLNPVTSGETVRVPVPALTEERRRELSRLVKAEAEAARVAVRNVRRDANTHLKELLKEKTVSEDEEKRAQDQVQKLTDKMIALVESLLAEKEKELMVI